MTREEARQILEDYVKACREDDFFKLETGFTYEQVIEAMDMGAKSLLSHSLPSVLDEAAEKYLDGIFGKGKHVDSYIQLFKAGAEWGMNQCPLPEDATIFLKGVAEGKRLMMEEAVEGTITCAHLNRYILVPKLDESLTYGNKVKIIIVKEDK